MNSKLFKENMNSQNLINLNEMEKILSDSLIDSKMHSKLGNNVNLVIVMEELAELQQEISKFIRGKISSKNSCNENDYTYYNLLQEICDVELGLWYIKKIANVSDEDVNLGKRVKMTRLYNRMHNIDKDKLYEEVQ